MADDRARRTIVPRTDTPSPIPALRTPTIEQHEESAPSSSPTHRERLVTNPTRRDADSTGRWEHMPLDPAAVAHAAYRGERVADRVEAELGEPAVPARGKAATGIYLTIELGFAEVKREVATLAGDVRRAVTFVEAANAAALSRGTTGKELAWIVVRWLIPAAIVALLALLSGHVSLH